MLGLLGLASQELWCNIRSCDVDQCAPEWEDEQLHIRLVFVFTNDGRKRTRINGALTSHLGVFPLINTYLAWSLTKYVWECCSAMTSCVECEGVEKDGAWGGYGWSAEGVRECPVHLFISTEQDGGVQLRERYVSISGCSSAQLQRSQQGSDLLKPEVKPASVTGPFKLEAFSFPDVYFLDDLKQKCLSSNSSLFFSSRRHCDLISSCKSTWLKLPL